MQKVAFITGCSTGIGRELAIQLNEMGWKVVATARRRETLVALEKAGCLAFLPGCAPTPFPGAYCASKAAIHALSDVLRMELKPFGIKVITVQPGGIVTDFGKNCEMTVQATFKNDSWYAPIENYIHARAKTSQEKATPVELFVRRLIPKIMQKNPPAIIRLGKRSSTLPLMKRMLPEKWLDRLMMKKYGLDKL